jgi:glutamate N-acetyltransferase/amino-acid N-acetyltransferase
MATMLAFVATDANIAPAALQSLVSLYTRNTFNSVTVDGDTSTNDTLLMFATGQSGAPRIARAGDRRLADFRDKLEGVLMNLAHQLVRDGEGATKFITITVDEGESVAECFRVAKAIAHSPLVKTAFFASDPNLGRILAAIGNAGIADLDPDRVGLELGGGVVVANGARAATYTEEQGRTAMKDAEIGMRITLGRGVETATVWTCDFSYDYVKVNADYRS